MKLRSKILLLAVVPLLVAVSAIALGITMQTLELARHQKDVLRAAWIDTKEAELRHYVRLAYSAISPLLAAPDTPQTRAQALQTLSNMEFDRDGYFFVYGLDGVSLMHPRQPELVGRNLWDMRDREGTLVIQELLAAAHAGGPAGSPIRYLWEKPSAHDTVRKLGYVMEVQPWGWMLGTGIYIDDVQHTLGQVNAAVQSSISEMIGWVGGISAFCLIFVAVCGLALNISDQRQSDAKLRLLARQVVRSQEDERARLSRELHDGLSQLLVSIKLQLEAARTRLKRNPADAPQIFDPLLEGALGRLNGAVGEVRRISHNLRPTLLDDLSLPAALEHLTRESWETPQGAVRAHLHIEGAPQPMPENQTTALFRLAQEALANTLRHAQANRIDIRLRYAVDKTELIIHDNGRGFDLHAVRDDPRDGIGLHNMTERMATLGGELHIQSGRQGTTLHATLPRTANKETFA
ncbi:cache domain-containing protein [Bordetella holmesii]|uniref:cache domain-containing protein n=1 Tax=Bordetella holmesii TaxID=35814 RepID=UPI0012985D8A|nr:cache domain-containing protein [Bordetella holmesii]QGB08887.1 histidine kinase [Bordetella holmesii]QGB16284.1 histidine kinase [Bordetella holmesii]QGC44081.1 histidine kinase [Bordetella holmesii]QGC63993.1 histidine kinase [Bordetella holmesii]QJP54516.1 histidine kinase [Bordetella holmesii]